MHFRKLTDKPKDEIKPEEKIDEDNLTKSKIEDIGKGNNKYLPVFQRITATPTEQDTTATASESLSQETMTVDSVVASLVPNGDDSDKDRTAESQLVLYKGALIDIEKLLYQMQRSEKAREETELRLNELTKLNQEHEAKSTKARDKIKDLQSDLKGNIRKLSDAETNAANANVSGIIEISHHRKPDYFAGFFIFQKKCSEYHSILASIHDKVAPIFVKAERHSSRCVDPKITIHMKLFEKKKQQIDSFWFSI